MYYIPYAICIFGGITNHMSMYTVYSEKYNVLYIYNLSHVYTCNTTLLQCNVNVHCIMYDNTFMYNVFILPTC